MLDVMTNRPIAKGGRQRVRLLTATAVVGQRVRVFSTSESRRGVVARKFVSGAIEVKYDEAAVPLIGSSGCVHLPTRADALSKLLDYAYNELLWVSEAPNRGDYDGAALELATRARAACAHIERHDPERP